MASTYTNQPKSHSDSLLSRLFQDKLDRQKLSVIEIADLIAERKELLKKSIRDLEYQICDIGSIKLALENIKYFPDLEAHLKTKLSIEKSVNELELKKAEEYKQCWHDIVDLRKDLLAGLLEYESIQTKAELLSPKNPSQAQPQKDYSAPQPFPVPQFPYMLSKFNPYSWYSKPLTKE